MSHFGGEIFVLDRDPHTFLQFVVLVEAVMFKPRKTLGKTTHQLLSTRPYTLRRFGVRSESILNFLNHEWSGTCNQS